MFKYILEINRNLQAYISQETGLLVNINMFYITSELLKSIFYKVGLRTITKCKICH